jgi:hypothetical protein
VGGGVGDHTCPGQEQTEAGVGRLTLVGRHRKDKDNPLAVAVVGAGATVRRESVGRVSDRLLRGHLRWVKWHLRWSS